MLRPGGSRSGKSRSIIFLTISILLAYAAVANAQVSFTSPTNGATLTSLPITVSGTHVGASSVTLSIVQDPDASVPPSGAGGATFQANTTITSTIAWQTTSSLNLLNGKYRLTVSSNIDMPASIDITVNVANNPGFLSCVTDPGGQGVQAPLISWTPSGLSVTFNFKRSATADNPELNAAPTNYPVGTDFTCTQSTNGRTPRVLIFGGNPLVSTFAGWSFDGTTLTAKMESVAATLPNGTSLSSAMAGLFIQYDDNSVCPGTFPNLTGSYLAANASFSFGFTPSDCSGGSITGLSLTLDGPTGATAFFKAFFPNAAVNTFFGGSCSGISSPTVAGGGATTITPAATIDSLGCELRVDTTFASSATVTVSLEQAGPVPTLPQWGMILMVLSLLALGTWDLTGRPALLAASATGGAMILVSPYHLLSSLVVGQAIAGLGLLLYGVLVSPLVTHDAVGGFVAGMLLGLTVEFYRRSRSL
jgi:hypothetical protein